MTVNSLNVNESIPFTGLTTLTFNIPTTGIYSIGAKISIPWVDGSDPGAVATPPVQEKQTITTVADSAGSLNSKFWTFYDAGNINGYYVWYNINSAGVDPAPAGLTGIAVAGATNATASTLGGATRTAIAAAVSTVTVTGTTSGVILLNTQAGVTTAAADGTAATSFTFAVNKTGSYGAGSGLKLQIKNGSTVLLTLSNPSPSQPLVGGKVITQCTAADVITVVTSSLASVDALPNAVKGVLNIFQGE